MKPGASPTHVAAQVLALAARVVHAVRHEGQSADAALAEHAHHPEFRAVRAVALGAMRWCLRLEALILPLLAAPAGSTSALLRALLTVSVHQLEYSRNPRESSVSAAVDAARALGLKRAAGMVNAVLRRYLRERDARLLAADANPVSRHAQPEWFIAALQNAWPLHYEAILAANNCHPPLCLRVDVNRVSVAQYLEELSAAGLAARALSWLPGAVELARPVSVARLPRFQQGLASVQDAGAQLAAVLLAPRAGERVLDACAAPGGKTGALLERVDGALELLAIDSSAERLALVRENLGRLQRKAELRTADLAAEAAEWWDGRPFDAILLDAPCTATGVMRRHADLRLLRRSTDPEALAERQLALLLNVLRWLKPGGRLLYTTCSVLPTENDAVVRQALALRPELRPATLPALPAELAVQQCEFGIQLLPGVAADSDGFYYASLSKH